MKINVPDTIIPDRPKPTLLVPSRSGPMVYWGFKGRGTGKGKATHSVFDGVDYDSLWDNVVLLARFSGVDGATEWDDESSANHGAFAFGATAQLDTDITLYSQGTLLLDGNSDYIRLDDDPDWLMGTSVSFCIEAWAYLPTNTDAGKTIIGQYRVDNNRRSWTLNVQADANGNVFRFTYSLDGINASFIDSDDAAPEGAWTHVAVTRTAAGVINMWVNGVKQADEDTGITSAFYNSNHTLDVGRAFNNSSVNFWPGSLADIRITKGAPRYIDTFTPPTVRMPATGPS